MLTGNHESEFITLVQAGLWRLYDDIGGNLPNMGAAIQDWMKKLAGSLEPADLFLETRAFPLMLLPWWVEQQIMGANDPSFQVDIVYSNASLEYFTRLTGNNLGDKAAIEQELLPIAGYFMERFITTYQKYFDQQNTFWEFFHKTWAESCDARTAEQHFCDINRHTFTQLVSRKVCAAKIGVAAVCFRYNRPGLAIPWSQWIDTFGCWHLFEQELFNWQENLRNSAGTFLLSEAQRRKHQGETETSWMAREGLDWGMDQLHGWMKELRAMAFPSIEVNAYLDFRENDFLEHREAILAGLEVFHPLSISSKK